MAKALTEVGVEKLKPGDARREIADARAPGLYLVVQPSGSKSWALRYRLEQRSIKQTIGSYPKIGLAAARDAAREAMLAVAKGETPTKRSQDSFEAVAELFIERHAKRNRSWQQVERQLTRDVVPAWRGRRIGDITRRDIIQLLDEIVDRGSPIMANRALAHVRKLFNWALSRDIIATSPCAGVKAPSAETKRDRVLNDQELTRVWRAAGSFDYPFAGLIRLLVLTGQRLSEVAEAKWAEIDLDQALWTIPRERAKNDTAHQVPLPPQAVELLASLPRIAGCDFLFSTTGRTAVSGFSRAKANLDKALAADGPVPAWRLHDIRRTVATGMARLGVQLPVVEKVLNHTSGSFGGIVGVYQRHSFSGEKRLALQTWASHLEAITSDRPGNVVPMGA